eukprot:SAG25_NODE_2661_length_1462_cov_2.902421_1_plen_98_part_00
MVFKRDGTYYVLSGTGCCACLGGSTIYVQMSSSMAGPWSYAGDVGSNPTPFDPKSPNNFVTKAQASAVFEVPIPHAADAAAGGGAAAADVQYVWMGG